MKNLNSGKILAFTAFLALSFIFGGCPPKAKGTVRQIKPHQDVPSADTYCTYKVTASRGGGAIPVGGTICLLCIPLKTTSCVSTLTVSPAEGIEYDLTTLGSCVSCPSANTYE